MIVHLYIMQIVRLLLNFRSFFHCKVDISAKNSRGLTAFDMLQGDNQQIIKDMLRRASCFSTLHLPRVASNADYLKSPVPIDEKIYILFLRQSTKMTNDKRNILLVVAALLVTVTSKQATLSPPGRVWQANTSDSIAPATSTASSEYSQTSPFVGTTIMDKYYFFILAALNLISFCVTVFTIFVLLPSGFTIGLFIIPLYILSLCFVASLLITAPVPIDGDDRLPIYFMFSPLMVMFLEAIVRLR